MCQYPLFHCLILTFIPGRCTSGSRFRILSGVVNCCSLILPPVLRTKTSGEPHLHARVSAVLKVAQNVFGKKRCLLSHTESVQPVMARSCYSPSSYVRIHSCSQKPRHTITEVQMTAYDPGILISILGKSTFGKSTWGISTCGRSTPRIASSVGPL